MTDPDGSTGSPEGGPAATGEGISRTDPGSNVALTSEAPAEAVDRPGAKGQRAEGDLAAWESIRSSIGVFDELVMTLLTQGTLLVFAALGLIYGPAGHPRPMVTIVLGLGVFFGVFMLNLGVARYATSISVAVAAAKALEDRLWPERDAPNRITHRLASHRLAASQWLGRAYYRAWSMSLVVLVGVIVAALSIELLVAAPEAGDIVTARPDATAGPDQAATPQPSSAEAQ